MSGRGDEQAELALLQATKQGPADVLDLLAHARQAITSVLRGREGALHAVLLRLVKRERIVVVGRGERGLALYAAPGTPPVQPLADDAPFEPAEDPSSARTALRVVSGVRDAATRGRLQADVQAHLESLGKDRAAFGSPRVARNLLDRVDRRRPAVCLTSSGADSVRRFVYHEGPWIGGAALIWILLKVFVLQTYVIPSESMVPTLLKADRVVVFRFNEGEAPPRFAVTTFEGDDKTLVKRLIGLPGERVAILHGDVYIDDEILTKPPEIREALKTELGTWDLRAMNHPAGWTSATRDEGQTRVWRGGPFEAYVPRLGGQRATDFAMRDGYVDVDLAWSGAGTVELDLIRGPHQRLDGLRAPEETTFQLRVSREGIHLDVERFWADEDEPGRETLASTSGPIEPGPLRLSMSYVDGVLRASVGDFAYEQPVAAADGPLEVVLRMPQTEAGALSLTLARDVHYAHMGDRAVPGGGPGFRGKLNDHLIPEGHLFFLGDNTTNSTDSRYGEEMGDVPVSRVVGPVSVRIWPPSRWGRVR